MVIIFLNLPIFEIFVAWNAKISSCIEIKVWET
jgi:hypothetical protein